MISEFNMAEYIEYLEPNPKGESDKYMCPVCGGHNLSVAKDGKYRCWSGECDTIEIMKAVKQIAGTWVDARSNGSSRSPYRKKPIAKPKPLPPQADEITLIRGEFPALSERSEKLPNWAFIPKELAFNPVAFVAYHYSDSCRVLRYQGESDKEIRPFHLTDDGLWRCGKGGHDWPLYGRVLPDSWVLALEGEKDVDTALALGFPAVCPRGKISSKTAPELYRTIKDLGVLGVLAIADNDDAGIGSAAIAMNAAHGIGLPATNLGIKRLWHEAPAKGDFTDWINATGISGEDAMKAIVATANAKIQDDKAMQASVNAIANAKQKQQSERIPDRARTIRACRDWFGDRLRYNLRSREIELDGKILPDVDHIYLTINDEAEIDISKDFAIDLSISIAKQNEYDPVREYLDRVTSIADPISCQNLASEYFGLADHPLAAYFDRVILRWMIGAVARVYSPGCQFDLALILQGSQGYRKSSFLRTLAGSAFFCDDVKDLADKDELLKVHEAWISELAEIETAIAGKRSNGEVKAAITRRTDNIRPPYGRKAVKMPRRSVLCGSTNKPNFFSDETGNRRYCVVPVVAPITSDKLAKLNADRDGLWAYAVALFRAGTAYHLSPEEELLQAQQNQSYEIADPWESTLEGYLSGLRETSVTQCFAQVGLDSDKRDRRAQMRISEILDRLGFIKSGKRKSITVGDRVERVRIYETRDGQAFEPVQIPESLPLSLPDIELYQPHQNAQPKIEVGQEVGTTQNHYSVSDTANVYQPDQPLDKHNTGMVQGQGNGTAHAAIATGTIQPNKVSFEVGQVGTVAPNPLQRNDSSPDQPLTNPLTNVGQPVEVGTGGWQAERIAQNTRHDDDPNMYDLETAHGYYTQGVRGTLTVFVGKHSDWIVGSRRSGCYFSPELIAAILEIRPDLPLA